MGIRRILFAGLAVLTILTQSGCVIGVLCWPLFVVGTGVGLIGTGMTVGGVMINRPDLWYLGTGVIVAGVLLDKDNHGRNDALNPLPRTDQVAAAAGVEIADINSYNDNLNFIQEVAERLANDIRSQSLRTDLIQYKSIKDLAADPELDELAKKYGFDSSAEFLETFKYEKLPRDKVQRFADATHLELAQAKILLFYGFSVRSE
jgi:hypothetical protein